jgi:rhamnose transport system permease protein
MPRSRGHLSVNASLTWPVDELAASPPMNNEVPPSQPPRAPPWRRLLRWEVFLALVIAADFALNVRLSPYFLSTETLADVSFNFTEKGLVALPMALLIIAGEIDISVAATMALVSVCMGLLAARTTSLSAIVGCGLSVGFLAGALNGALVTRWRVPAIVATIGTMSLYRGIAYGILGDRVLKDYPPAFAFLGQGYIAGPVSFELLLFTLAAVVCALYLHRTEFGRRLVALGFSKTAAEMAGVRVNRYRFWLFVATGVTSALASVLLTSRLGSTRPSIAEGMELDVISIVILGGVAISGGRGSIAGVVLAAILTGLAIFGLGLINVPGVVVSLLMGALLILIVGLPIAVQRLARWRMRMAPPQ